MSVRLDGRRLPEDLHDSNERIARLAIGRDVVILPEADPPRRIASDTERRGFTNSPNRSRILLTSIRGDFTLFNVGF
jgi:hypothetical protein